MKIDIQNPKDHPLDTIACLLRSRHMSSAQRRKLKREADVQINGKTADWGTRLRSGDRIVLTREEPMKYAPEPLQIPIVWEDPWFLIISKPAGMLSHPTPQERCGTVENQVISYLGSSVFHPVHRLDRWTSGLMLIAKSAMAQYDFDRLSSSTMIRTYDGFSYGACPVSCGSIRVPIARKPGSIIERCVSADGQSAWTDFTVQARSRGCTWFRFLLHTGRTHQIRVHMSWFGYPLIGDTLYGSSGVPGGRQLLHAGQIWFCHPYTHHPVSVSSPYPEDMLLHAKKCGWCLLPPLPNC